MEHGQMFHDALNMSQEWMSRFLECVLVFLATALWTQRAVSVLSNALWEHLSDQLAQKTVLGSHTLRAVETCGRPRMDAIRVQDHWEAFGTEQLRPPVVVLQEDKLTCEALEVSEIR